MAASPYKPEDLRDARAAVTDADKLSSLDPLTQARIARIALTILRKDRALRLNLQDQKVEAKVLTVPRAVFEAGPRRIRHRITLACPSNHTPGDAA